MEVVGWRDGAGYLLVLGRPTNLDKVEQGITVLVTGAGRDCLIISSLVYHFSVSFYLSLGDNSI